MDLWLLRRGLEVVGRRFMPSEYWLNIESFDSWPGGVVYKISYMYSWLNGMP